MGRWVDACVFFLHICILSLCTVCTYTQYIYSIQYDYNNIMYIPYNMYSVVHEGILQYVYCTVYMCSQQ